MSWKRSFENRTNRFLILTTTILKHTYYFKHCIQNEKLNVIFYFFSCIIIFKPKLSPPFTIITNSVIDSLNTKTHSYLPT